jgi:hypothetical protein
VSLRFALLNLQNRSPYDDASESKMESVLEVLNKFKQKHDEL